MVRVRVPHEDQPGKPVQRIFNTVATSDAILDLADHLIGQGVTRVAMEATSTYWPFVAGSRIATHSTWCVIGKVRRAPGAWPCRSGRASASRPAGRTVTTSW